MYWDDILKEVLNKNKASCKFLFTNYEADNNALRKKRDTRISTRRRKLESYKLGDNFKGIALTQREAECMTLILRGKTIAQIGKVLHLSPRTVEFYIKNIKTKLKCRTKSELIGKILESDFVNYKINIKE